MKRILVAGATGYLGKHVVRELKEQGYWVRALARNPDKLKTVGQFLEPAVHDLADEVFVGEVTDPTSLAGVCDDMDGVFSSIGITRQRDGVSFMDVDYQGNKNLLAEAQKSGVGKFIFVSVIQSPDMPELAPERELFARELEASGMPYTVIRPTGYYSDMSEFLNMARSGRVYLLGNGDKTINPIHGSDLAKVCADAFDRTETSIPVGGPQVLSYRQIAELAFSVLDKRPKVSTVPLSLAKGAVKIVGLFSSHLRSVGTFFVTVMGNDINAPEVGTHGLEAYFRELDRS